MAPGSLPADPVFRVRCFFACVGKAAFMTDEQLTPDGPWKCFHCWETFTEWTAARSHFGATPEALNARPRCVWRAERMQKKDAEIARLTALLNTPELLDFSAAVQREAAHQRERWGVEHDIGKAPADWFWLLGYLAGKALAAQLAGDESKALHHTISTAAACANWHAAILGQTNMRPGSAKAAVAGAHCAPEAVEVRQREARCQHTD